ncbi:MAG: hypothetical protein JNK14_20835 [Chitinophagaceae bacterium]|nr:hypothetical protein [Chitinophagaceae bacterium]
MKGNPQPDKTAALVHWTYSYKEWRTFILWKKRNKGFFHYLFYLLLPKRKQGLPFAVVTMSKVYTEDLNEIFRDTDRLLKRVGVRDTGKMNILEITYEMITGDRPALNDIYLPIPRGKLREAIGLQEIITAHS